MVMLVCESTGWSLDEVLNLTWRQAKAAMQGSGKGEGGSGERIGGTDRQSQDALAKRLKGATKGGKADIGRVLRVLGE